MTAVMLFPNVPETEGYFRLAQELLARMTRGEELGARQMQMSHLDALIERSLVELRDSVSDLPDDDLLAELLRTAAQQIVEYATLIRESARETVSLIK